MKLKKILGLAVVASCFTLASCGKTEVPTLTGEQTTDTNTGTTGDKTTDDTKKEIKTMSYAEFVAAAKDSEVRVQGVITDRCTFYDGKASFYLQDKTGGYYIYNLACTAEQYATLVPGTELQVTGAKAEWKGQLEVDYGKATENQEWKIIASNKEVPMAIGVNDIAKATLDNYKNRKVITQKLTVTTAAYTWGEDGSKVPLVAGSGVDIYIDVTDGTTTSAFVVEAYLEDTQFGSDTYTKVANLAVGDEIYLEGFIYYYNNPQMQIQKVYTTSHERYVNVANGTEVSFQAVITDRCTFYDGKASFYFANAEGGYYAYNMTCTEAEYATLVPGTEVKVTAAKTSWRGLVEVDFGIATENQGWQIVSTGNAVPAAISVTDIAKATLDQYKNQKVATGELTVVGDAKYGWDGSGEAKAGQDLYFDVTDGTNTLTFVVEAYLEDTQFGSTTYTTVEGLKDGDKVELEGFIYYYDNPQMQVTKVTKK